MDAATSPFATSRKAGAASTGIPEWNEAFLSKPCTEEPAVRRAVSHFVSTDTGVSVLEHRPVRVYKGRGSKFRHDQCTPSPPGRSSHGDFAPRCPSPVGCWWCRLCTRRTDCFGRRTLRLSWLRHRGCGSRTRRSRRASAPTAQSVVRPSSTPSTARSSISKVIRAARTTGDSLPEGCRNLPASRQSRTPTQVLHRAPGAAEWEVWDLDRAMDRVARAGQEDARRDVRRGRPTARSSIRHTGIFSLGGATLDNECNHIQQKLMRGLGIVAIENQARI